MCGGPKQTWFLSSWVRWTPDSEHTNKCVLYTVTSAKKEKHWVLPGRWGVNLDWNQGFIWGRDIKAECWGVNRNWSDERWERDGEYSRQREWCVGRPQRVLDIPGIPGQAQKHYPKHHFHRCIPQYFRLTKSYTSPFHHYMVDGLFEFSPLIIIYIY